MTTATRQHRHHDDDPYPQDLLSSDRGHSAACLDPGTLVYLWPPNEPNRSCRPSLVRVEKATAHVICGVDISSTPAARAQYEVSSDYPTGLRWTWEVAVPPQPPCPDGVAFLDRTSMALDDRRAFIFGPPGQVVTIFTTDAGPVTGTVNRVLMHDGAPMFVEVAGPPDDPRGAITHVVRFDHITKVQRVERHRV